jgi:hypothetical protein
VAKTARDAMRSEARSASKTSMLTAYHCVF